MTDIAHISSFTFNSVIDLIKTFQSFQNNPKRVRDLKEEVEALKTVLSSLNHTIDNTTDVNLSNLELPLRRCGKACEEFQQEIEKCSSRSGKDKKSFRDWAKLRYMGDDIDAFRQLINTYKTTIIIALTDASLRQSSITNENLGEYKDLIQNATDDLEAHKQRIDEKLEIYTKNKAAGSSSDTAELKCIQEERLSTQKSLQICSQLAEHISQIQAQSGTIVSEDITSRSIQAQIVFNGLEECKNSLSVTSSKLEGHMSELMDRLVSKTKAASSSKEDIADLERLQEEWNATRRSIDILSKADAHLKENVSTIDNYATGDAIQFMVSTNGKTISGRNRGVGWKTRQVGGHLSDESLQKISQHMMHGDLRSTGNSGSPMSGPVPANEEEIKQDSSSEFAERYGHGFQLTSK